MIVLAILMLVVVAAVVVFMLVTGATTSVPLEWDALSLSWAPSALVVFLLGALTLCLAELALAMLRGGTRRKIERRRELRRLRRVEKEQAAHDVADGTPGRHEAPVPADTTGTEATRADVHGADTTRAHTTSATAPGRPVAPPPEADRGSWHDTPPERR
jgi:hypothetical protein